MSSDDAVIGVSDHNGWAVLVTVGDGGALLDRRRIELCGRPIVWRDMVASRFRDGLIAEDWVITDLAERLLLARKGRGAGGRGRRPR